MSDKRRILIADPSRVARTALVRLLRDDFDIREEGDGESAWQTLVLDASIVAVVSSISLPRLSGYELLSRLRQNRLRRLADLPFFLLISQDETAPNREAAKERGVSDFIVRGASADEIRRGIGRLVNWDLEATAQDADGETAFGTRTHACRHLCNRMAEIADLESWSGSVLAFGLESESAISERFGAAVMRDIGQRFARVIRSKLGPRDLIAHLGGSIYIVASLDTSPATAIAFAQRVCSALGERRLRIGSDTLQVAVSAGLAALPTEHGKSAAQLIDIAVHRLELARQTPGGQVVSSDPPADDPFARIEALLRQQDDKEQLGSAGQQLLPLLRLLEQQFHFGLPLGRMEEELRKYASHPPSPE
ncbi:diguanylate cyclase [Azonexus sp.]|uniref:diguanylate cyclase n=1 Tax=Azonexus sp. TaxID=1872668 RepID=UPI0035B4A4AF